MTRGSVPEIRRTIPLYCETATEDLSVLPRGTTVYHTDCTCRERRVGRTMIDGVWVKVCLRCHSLREGSGT